MKNPSRKNALNSKPGSKGDHKIGLYVRVSTEEQAENPEGSIRNQEERLKAAVQLKNLEAPFGEIVGTFIDRAKSGKDTNRPELQRLLEAIRRREISLVMVSELSRLSRSIKDFSEIWELMQASGCGFFSLRESFDTTTAAGEMVLYTVANIAQFERRQVAERVSANIQARASRGLYNGGLIPVGYRLIPEKRGYLEIDPDRAELIRKCFQVFLERGSLSPAALWLNENGYRVPRATQGGGSKPRIGHFTVSNLHDILRNKSYAGIRTYKAKGEIKETKAVWEPIVEKTVFDRVQEVMDTNHSRYKPETYKKHPYPLSGALFCSQCKGSLSGKSAHGNGGKVAYYEHSWLTKRNGCLLKKSFSCKPFRIRAELVESLIWADIEEFFQSPKLAEDLIRSANENFETQRKSDEEKKLRTRISDLESQLEVLAERLALLPKSLSPAPIYKQMEKIQTDKEEQSCRLGALKQEGYSQEIPADLTNYRSLLETFKRIKGHPHSGAIEGKIIRALVDRIEITPEGSKIHYRTGRDHVEGALAKASALLHKLSGKPSRFEELDANPISLFHGSHTLTNGGPYRDRTPDHRDATPTRYMLSAKTAQICP